jgi:hypothetical protein
MMFGNLGQYWSAGTGGSKTIPACWVLDVASGRVLNKFPCFSKHGASCSSERGAIEWLSFMQALEGSWILFGHWESLSCLALCRLLKTLRLSDPSVSFEIEECWDIRGINSVSVMPLSRLPNKIPDITPDHLLKHSCSCNNRSRRLCLQQHPALSQV